MEKSKTLPTNPALWEDAKKKARATSEGSEPGRWSARKSVLAQVSYAKRGGGWEKDANAGAGDHPKSGASENR